MAAQQERAAEAAIRAEQRAAMSAGGITAPPDMPGAEPRPGYTRQRIGEMDFLFEPEFAKERRTAEHERVAKDADAAAKEAARRSRIDAAVDAAKRAGMNEQKVRALMEMDPALQSVMGARMFPAPTGLGPDRQLTPGQRQSIADEEAEAEAAFNTAMRQDSPLRQALVSSFRSLRKARPTARPQELMRAALAAARTMRVPLAAPRPTAAAGGGGDPLDSDMEKYDVNEPVSAQGARPVARPAPRPAPQAQATRSSMSPEQEARIAQLMQEEGYDDAYISQYLNGLRRELQ